MPLPTNPGLPWPPKLMAPMYSKMAEWAAWYSGEPQRIMDVYASPAWSNAPNPWWRFYTRAKAAASGAQRAVIHVPLAGDLAATSGALLFGDPPVIRVRAAREEPPIEEPEEPPELDEATGLPKPAAPKKPEPKPETPEQKAETRLLQIIEEGGVNARLVEAAEAAAALGGVYIYPVWDKDLRPFPLMAVAQSDMAVPEFRFGLLVAVTFHRVVHTNGNDVFRVLERHEVEGTGESRKAVVLTGVYKGNTDNLGTLALGGDDITGFTYEPRVELPFKELDVEYVPNMLPNRLWRAESLGIADISGSETLLDSLDEVYASWMRDIRLAKARILVPREYLRPDSDNRNQPTFDLDQEVYVGMDMEPGLAQDARSMLAHQFQIRYKEHQETARDLVDRIVSNAGYSATTMSTDSADGTGTALRISEHKTLLTLRKKSGWWRAAVANTLHRMMLIDVDVFGEKYKPVRPTVLISDSIIDNPLELAQTALALKTAESASIETRVRLVHPDWSGAEVAAEVARIQGDIEQAKPPAPTIGGGFGKPGEDPASTSKFPNGEPAKGPVTNLAGRAQAGKKPD